MNILTDEEMKQIHADTFGKGLQSFARAIEAAVLSKLAEQAIEPTGYWYPNDPVVYAYPNSDYFPGEALSNDAIDIVPLFSEASLAGAQQKAAEACAKVIRGEGIGFADDDEEMSRIAEMLEAGEWRGYL